MKEPVDHIHRPKLPWRTGAGLTECGLDASKVPTLTRDQYLQRHKDMGQQRTAILTCMTCATTAQRWKDWNEDPCEAVGREVEWATGWRRKHEPSFRLRDELLAIEALIEAHRDEFDAHIAQTEQRRAWNEQKAAHAAKPKQPRHQGGL